MPGALHFTDFDEANELIATDPMALLVGFALDKQVTVQKAFSGPLDIRERIGAIDAETLASTDLEPVFRRKPAIHRYPGAMATRVGELAVVNTGAVVDHDNDIGPAAHVAPGVALAGNVRVGARALVGVGSAVRPGIRIGADAVVGAGSAVVADVADGAVVGGAPARASSSSTITSWTAGAPRPPYSSGHPTPSQRSRPICRTASRQAGLPVSPAADAAMTSGVIRSAK